ncbi:superoxide dismutase [Novosphingobium album (ex Liu et al. 2023)]|uniref:Superoxide dismutase n=1 Tax=Novosphingobium album (ex Liu et al. 2023) TaxID=3031130 RepID=A0ABT5WMS2_9SPHN|nr:superoxide dismutase [Novosphingobium album (ex Liu et al. 2023)]MDE8651331.1 superoxide dismutase [Novosphingobium album (ex Liu et al. 2023)]
MTISLMPLPYALDALAPHISKDTLEVHHGAHHKTYVDKLNAAIEGTDDADKPLEDIIKSASGPKFNNAAQVYNHGFYWHSLSPEKTAPSESLAAAITADFGSLDALLEALTNEAVNHFASGWAWLVVDGGKLKVISTHDAGTTVTEDVNPLVTIDVWEHAYYVDQKNKRPAYVKAVLDNLINWKFASDNFDRGTPWIYPA